MNIFSLRMQLTVTIMILFITLASLAIPYAVFAQGTTATNPPGQATTQQQDRSRPSSCDSWRGYVNPLCWIKDIVIGLSAMIVYFCALILALAGSLFNLLVDHTIVNFSAWFYSDAMKGAIETAWAAFRDLANIVIIGMFVFIAISMILGLEEFGRKKMVAKVIIVAVLINFSLLFTKVVIDFSNFTAKQFYDAAQIKSAEGSGTTGPQNYAQKGIGGAFMQYLGVTTLTQTHDSIKKAAGDDWIGEMGFIHAAISSMLLIATAVVLFYGSFLLISRAILLLFLILTSAIAFAAYLFPSKTIEGGFYTWWGSLLKSAIFAPLLMVLLWITITIAKAMQARVGGSGTLGDIVAHPTKDGNLNMLMGYFIVLGLLFISLKISSSFSTQIAGFKWASIAPALATSAGGQLFSAVATRTIGRGAWLAGNAMETRAREAKSGLGRGLYSLTAAAVKPVAKSDLNPLRTPVAGSQLTNAISRTSGLSAAALAGPKLGGREGQLKRMGEKAAEKEARTGQKAEFVTRPEAEQKKIREEAERAAAAGAGKVAAGLTESTRAARAEAGRTEERRAVEAERKEASRMQAFKEALSSRPMEKDKRDYEAAEKEVKLSKEQMDRIASSTAQEKRASEDRRNALVEERKTVITKNDDVSKKRLDEIDKQLATEKSHLARILKGEKEKIEKLSPAHIAAKKKMEEIKTKVTSSPEFQKKMAAQEKQLESAVKAQERAQVSFTKTLTESIKRVPGTTMGESEVIHKYKLEAQKKGKEEQRPRYQERQEMKKLLEELKAQKNTPGSGGGEQH